MRMAAVPPPGTGTAGRYSSRATSTEAAVIGGLVDTQLPLKAQMDDAVASAAMAAPSMARALSRECRAEEVARLPAELNGKSRGIADSVAACAALPEGMERLEAAVARAVGGTARIEALLGTLEQRQPAKR